MKWSINKDESIILKKDNDLLAGIWKAAVKDDLGLIAVIYGEYPTVRLHQKFFNGEGQVKEAKKWIEGLIK